MHSFCLLLTSCLAGADPGFASTMPEPAGNVAVGYCYANANPPVSVVYPYNLMQVGHWGSGCCASGNCGSGNCAPAAACDDCAKRCFFCRFKERCRKACQPDCDPCAKKHLFQRFKCHKPDCCEKPKCCEQPKCCAKPKTECCKKDDCCKPRLIDRLKACFHKKDCCDSCTAEAAAPAKGAEPIKMPKEDKEKKEGAFELLPQREAPLPKGPPAIPTSNPIPF